MESILKLKQSKISLFSIIWDLIAVTFVFFMPTITHLLNFPLYLFEPMRVLIVLSLLHTKRINSYLLALTLPLFSFFVAGHPVFYKMLIISGELLLNVWLFIILSKEVKNVFYLSVLSIVVSKIFYYVFQYLFITLSLLTWEEVEHPILPQLLVVLGLSGYAFMVNKLKKVNSQ